MVLKMKYPFRMVLVNFLMSVSVFSFAQAPSNHNATTTAIKQYQYLFNYKSNSSNCILMGQSLGHKNQIIDYYQSYIQRIKNESGHTPAIIGGDLGLEGELDPDLLGELFQTYAQSGGMVTLSWQSINPWSGTYYAQRDKFRDFRRLWSEGDTLHTIWMKELDEVAEILQNFQERDVAVLWRPFSDMNGDWYWWGANPMRDPEDFKKLWRYTYDYLTTEKGLNNLLWVFSVNQSTILTDEPTYWLKGDTYFPGQDYVDIVGMTLFDDNLEMSEYHDFLDLKRFNKPLALTLCGPKQETADGNFDYLDFLSRINENFPEIVYAYVMHSYSDVKLALTDNKNYVELFSQSCVVNSEEIDYNIEWQKDNKDLLSGIKVFPQPTDDYFFVSLPSILSESVQITLRNMLGVVVFEKVVDQVYFLEVSLPKLSSGTYLLNISTEESSFAQKLILQ